MLASTIPFTTNPPTPTHNPQQPGAPDRSGNQGALPQNPDSMPPPHTQGHPPPADHHNHKAAAAHHSGRVSYTNHHNQPAPHSETSQSWFPCVSPSRPAQTHTAQTNRQPGDHPHTNPILRKEVIQPHLPVRLPCYDLVPIASPTFDGSPHQG